MSRQGMRKLMTENEATFPSPVHAGNTGVWHLADVLGWLITERNSIIDSATVELANEARRINLAKQINALPAGALEDAIELVSSD
ncbi:prophage CP4-57 regulatory [Asticcacaulis biprosthecium C19]|uniref:Prophage CP4-57 regulatory n=2 Tax=Asticcacaulis biprosthecium TaxID=76891 RepID=F4QT45_9CAUL|nr:prophage CP4-57 regulatory [Asticcacaulis biprosthecium C19]